MKLQDQCCSLEQAKKLKELGITNSYFVYGETLPDMPLEAWTVEGTEDEFYPAFTVAELGVMMPNGRDIGSAQISSGRTLYPTADDGAWWCIGEQISIESQMNGVPAVFEYYDETEAQSRAALLIHLLETGKITLSEVNERLTN